MCREDSSISTSGKATHSESDFLFARLYQNSIVPSNEYGLGSHGLISWIGSIFLSTFSALSSTCNLALIFYGCLKCTQERVLEALLFVCFLYVGFLSHIQIIVVC